jgi:hypothetical protein
MAHEEAIVKPGIYEHYKKRRYEVLNTARNSENLEVIVHYKALYYDEEFGQDALWVRTQKEFLEEVEVDGQKMPRFRYVGPAED